MKHFTVIHVSSLLSTATPRPLLRLVWLEDRGICKFVGLLKNLANIATTILSYLISKNPCQPLVTTFHPHLIKNSIFTCDKHKDKICKVIIKLVIKPILNICLKKSRLHKNEIHSE
jgi:hypothetical protein